MPRTQSPQQLPRIPQPRLPHPSWRLGGEPPAQKEALSANDFWKRLGI
ncbi:MAG: hypothetical protein RIS94_2586 [Pseudomonadota bacterium]|jgi:hypothetical protein